MHFPCLILLLLYIYMDNETLHLKLVYFFAFRFIKTETSWIFVKTQFFLFILFTSLCQNMSLALRSIFEESVMGGRFQRWAACFLYLSLLTTCHSFAATLPHILSYQNKQLSAMRLRIFPHSCAFKPCFFDKPHIYTK